MKYKTLPLWKRCQYCGRTFKRLDVHQRKHRLHVWAEFANNPLVQFCVYGHYIGFVQLQLQDSKSGPAR
jgi:hypothetical protein